MALLLTVAAALTARGVVIGVEARAETTIAVGRRLVDSVVFPF